MPLATGTSSTAAPAALDALLERYDPDVIDLPRGRARIRLEVRERGEWDALAGPEGVELQARGGEPDSLISADAATWRAIARDLRGGMGAFRRGRLDVRRNLHLGVGFLAAVSGAEGPGRLRFGRLETEAGRLATMSAGDGPPVVCLHGLGGTKASFLPTVSALAETNRVIAIDLPGFGDSDKPLSASYDAPYFADAAVAALDALGLERADLVGNSMGGRVAIEAGLRTPDRVGRLVLLSPAVAWLRDRNMKWLVSLPLPRLGLLQPTPRVLVEPIVRRLVPGGDRGWSAAGVDEFLRSYLTASGGTRSTSPHATSTSTSPTERTASGTGSGAWRRRRCSSGDFGTTSSRSAFASTSNGRCRRPVTSSSTAGTCRSSRRPSAHTPRFASSSAALNRHLAGVCGRD